MFFQEACKIHYQNLITSSATSEIISMQRGDAFAKEQMDVHYLRDTKHKAAFCHISAFRINYCQLIHKIQ